MSTSNEKTMTMREFMTAVANGNITDDVTAFAASQIEKLDAKNSSRAVKQAEKSATENAPLMKQMIALLTEHPEGLLSSEIASAMGLHPSKVSALGKKLVEQGKVTTDKVKVPKVGERVKYTIA